MRLPALILLAALLVTGSAAGSVSRSSVNDAVFRDAVGEDPLAPDITTVRVANDDAGALTFRIATPNRPALREDLRLSMYLDTDDNASTGLAPNGMDVRLLYDVYLHGDPQLWLLRCNGSICSSLGGTKIPLRYAGGPTFTIDRSELGDTRRFRFWIAAMDGIVYDPAARSFDLANAHGDTAPVDPARSWTYAVQIGPRRLLVERFTTARNVAGETFLARLTVKRDDTGARVTAGKVRCAARVGGVPARVESRGFRRSAAVCTWGVPRRASGKTVRGTITVTFAGKTVSRSFVKAIS